MKGILDRRMIVVVAFGLALTSCRNERAYHPEEVASDLLTFATESQRMRSTDAGEEGSQILDLVSASDTVRDKSSILVEAEALTLPDVPEEGRTRAAVPNGFQMDVYGFQYPVGDESAVVGDFFSRAGHDDGHTRLRKIGNTWTPTDKNGAVQEYHWSGGKALYFLALGNKDVFSPKVLSSGPAGETQLQLTLDAKVLSNPIYAAKSSTFTTTPKDGKVNLDFKILPVAIAVKVDKGHFTGCQIHSVKIDKMYTKGTYGVKSASWSGLTGEKEVSLRLFDPYSPIPAEGGVISGGDNLEDIFFIPQTLPKGTKIQIEGQYGDGALLRHVYVLDKAMILTAGKRVTLTLTANSIDEEIFDVKFPETEYSQDQSYSYMEVTSHRLIKKGGKVIGIAPMAWSSRTRGAHQGNIPSWFTIVGYTQNGKYIEVNDAKYGELKGDGDNGTPITYKIYCDPFKRPPGDALPNGFPRTSKEKQQYPMALEENETGGVLNLANYNGRGVPNHYPQEVGPKTLPGAYRTSNCYLVVKKANVYYFPCVMGNSIKDNKINDEAFTVKKRYGGVTTDFVNYKGETVNHQNIFIDAKSVEILWADADFGGTYVKLEESLNFAHSMSPRTIKFVKVIMDKQKIGQKGNMLIAVRDAEGTIMWSWHLWFENPINFTHKFPVKIQTDGKGDREFLPYVLGYIFGPNNHPRRVDKVQLRNLQGKQKTVTGELISPNFVDRRESRALYYMWGRKDPLPSMTRVYDIQNGVQRSPKESILYQASAAVDVSTVFKFGFTTGLNTPAEGISFGIRHPTYFFEVPGGIQYYPYLWDANAPSYNPVKTVYDPCPAGYQVPGLNDMSWIVHGTGARDFRKTAGREFYGYMNADTSKGYFFGRWFNTRQSDDLSTKLEDYIFVPEMGSRAHGGKLAPDAGYMNEMQFWSCDKAYGSLEAYKIEYNDGLRRLQIGNKTSHAFPYTIYPLLCDGEKE